MKKPTPPPIAPCDTTDAPTPLAVGSAERPLAPDFEHLYASITQANRHRAVSELTPLRSKEASSELQRVMSRLGKQEKTEELSEADVIRLIRESE